MVTDLQSVNGVSATSRRRDGTPACFGGRQAFTLVEIVIALTVVTIIVAGSIPTFRGLRDEQMAREPVQALARLSKEARLRAMKEKRPYQIAFFSTGFTASRHFNPYLQMQELSEFMQETTLAAQADVDGDAEEVHAGLEDATPTTELPLAPPPKKADDQWSENYTLPADTHYSIQFWHEQEPVFIEGDQVKLWVFQPSGICQPLTMRLDRTSASFEVQFGALTADIIKEKSDLK
jgi:prepilin-type N-terminal cleavage/methylation domain-containing protein